MDAYFYRFIVTYFPHSYRHLVPGIIVLSIFAGYFVWHLAHEHAEYNGERSDNSFGTIAAFFLAVFVFFYVISPIMNHYAPGYWTRVTDSSNTDEDSGL